jgi:hypothetical protein
LDLFQSTSKYIGTRVQSKRSILYFLVSLSIALGGFWFMIYYWNMDHQNTHVALFEISEDGHVKPSLNLDLYLRSTFLKDILVRTLSF